MKAGSNAPKKERRSCLGLMGNMQTEELIFSFEPLGRGQIDSLIRGFWQELLRNPSDALDRFCNDDICFRVLGHHAARSGPLTYQGRDAVGLGVRNIHTNLQFMSFDIEDLIIDGHDAALRWHARFRHRGTGATGEFCVFDHIVLRNGLISSYSEFLDTDGFVKLMAGDAQPRFARQSNCHSRGLKPASAIANADMQGVVDMFARNRRERMVRDYWADRIKRGSIALVGCFTDDCELHFIGDPTAIPFARIHRGLEAARALTDRIDMEFEFLSFQIERVLVDGDHAAVHWSAHVRHRGTNARGMIESFDHIVFRGDQILTVTKFFDTAQTVQWVQG
jgi:ketosteroid isomerase-like protein